jgi:phosphoenolpyruvate carboxykinase (GTP)
VLPIRGELPDHDKLIAWVAAVAVLTRPAEIEYCDGSADEWDRLTRMLEAQGKVIRLSPERRPNSFFARTDPDDTARVEDRTYICSAERTDAGPTNNWVDPALMKLTMRQLYKGCMRGRTMYVVPFCMGSLDAVHPQFGVEITDSAYVVASMHIMTRMGKPVVDAMVKAQAPFVRALHSVGYPLATGEADVPWPCNREKYISHFPETREIWSYGSGYGGNSLLGKKCFALRVGSVIGRDEGWMAEHMLLLQLTSPRGKKYHICAAFPSACGKTNLALLQPTLPRWKAEALGDDIVWMRPGHDGRLYGVNPESGMFGVAPGTSQQSNPNVMEMMARGNTIFTNVALTDDGDVWWEGMTKQPPEHLVDWRGRPWTPAAPTTAAHPNARYTIPMDQCPVLAPEYELPNGVPIDAIIFGGRRPTTVPLVNQARDWVHGVFLGATCSSETTAAASGAVGVVRRDPMAMLPFIGYHVDDYLQHWLDMGEKLGPDKQPKIFYVNWFRKDADGHFLWPGFGDNVRVMDWICRRLDGSVDAVSTPIGDLPRPEDLDVTGLDLGEGVLDELTRFDADAWKAELPLIEQWFDHLAADKKHVPDPVLAELDALREACG